MKENRYFVAEYSGRAEVRDRNNPGRGVLDNYSRALHGPMFLKLAEAQAQTMNMLEDRARDAMAFNDCQPIHNGGRGV